MWVAFIDIAKKNNVVDFIKTAGYSDKFFLGQHDNKVHREINYRGPLRTAVFFQGP